MKQKKIKKNKKKINKNKSPYTITEEEEKNTKLKCVR